MNSFNVSLNQSSTGLEKYIFPGGYIPSLRELIWLLPDYDFNVIDVESLRMHYAMTLDRWSGRTCKSTQSWYKKKCGRKLLKPCVFLGGAMPTQICFTDYFTASRG